MPARKSTVSALISCEHASCVVPAEWRELFSGHEQLLASHRGYDRGSLDLAEALADRLDAPLLAGRVTRLLVDLNRSAGHPRHFSEFTRPLPRAERARIDAEYWQPHWQAYREHLNKLPGRIVHVACHSFVPVLDGRERNADIGLLYDPVRAREKAWCQLLARLLRDRLPALKLRMNYPYRGTSNGMGQQHRPLYDDFRLVTMEIEINQRLCDRSDWPATIRGVAKAVVQAIAQVE